MKDKYTVKNMEIRKMLQDIIQVAYEKDSPHLLESYKKFYLEISKKQVRSYAGRYNFDKHSILIVGLHRPSKHILITAIHEVSHHIDYCNRKTSDHKKEFYEIYQRLIHTALDMKFITKEDIYMVSDVADLNKIKKFLDTYKEKSLDYKKDKVIIVVQNGYPFR